MKRFSVLILAACCIFASAVDNPKLPEASKTRLLSKYKSAVIAQTNYALAQQRMQQAIKEYQDARDKEVKENNLPKGTDFKVDIDADEVTVIEPPPAPKPEKK